MHCWCEHQIVYSLLSTQSLSSTTTTRRSTRSATRIGSRRTPMWSAAPTRTRRPRPPAAHRQPADLDELQISRRTRTTTCRSGGFALAVAPSPLAPPLAPPPPPPPLAPSPLAVAPLRKFIVNISVRLLGPSVRQHSLRTSRTPTYETYDHPYVELDVVRVVRRTTSRCFTYGPP